MAQKPSLSEDHFQGATPFFTDKVSDIHRVLKGGFARGEAEFQCLGDWAGHDGRIAIQNENLVLWVDGRSVTMVPDLIINLDLDTGEPIRSEILRYGQRLAVIGLPAHDLLETPETMAVVGPVSFGYPDLIFTPLRPITLSWPCNPRWHTLEGIVLVGPRCFRYERDDVPLVV